jgi:hypothetical protein
MDGIIGDYFGTELNGSLIDLQAHVIDKRALEDPLFDIQITPLTSDDNVMSVSLKFTYIDSLADFTGPLIFQAALVETDVESNGFVNTNVVRKLILGPEGLTVNTTWTRGFVYTKDQEYVIDVPINNPNNLYLVAFVQDKNNNRRIHQAVMVPAPPKNGLEPVGVEDNWALAEIQNIQIYPNPASKFINIAHTEVLSRNYRWEIIDQRGVPVLNGDLKHDLRTPQEVAIKDLANGVYFMKIAQSEKAVIYKKIVILNQN